MSSVYPIATSLLTPASPTPIKGEILKLTNLGFLVQVVTPQNWQTGDRAQVQFQLPGVARDYDEPVKVIKAYLKWAQSEGAEKVKVQIFEMHFLSLAASKKLVIDQFVAAHKSSADESG